MSVCKIIKIQRDNIFNNIASFHLIHYNYHHANTFCPILI